MAAAAEKKESTMMWLNTAAGEAVVSAEAKDLLWKACEAEMAVTCSLKKCLVGTREFMKGDLEISAGGQGEVRQRKHLKMRAINRKFWERGHT